MSSEGVFQARISEFEYWLPRSAVNTVDTREFEFLQVFQGDDFIEAKGITAEY